MLDELKNRRGRRGPRRGDHWARADFADARARSAVSALLKLPLCGPLRALRFNFSSFGWLRALDARRIEKPQRAPRTAERRSLGARRLCRRAREERVSALLKLPLCGPLRALRFNFSSFGWLRALDARRIENRRGPPRTAERRSLGARRLCGRAREERRVRVAKAPPLRPAASSAVQFLVVRMAARTGCSTN